MRDWRRLARLLGVGVVVFAAVVALTWALEHVVPAPYSGYLAAVVIGLVVIQIVKRQPLQRARRAFRIYLKARSRGADEAAARARLIARLAPAQSGRRDVDAAWTGPSERDRVLAGVAALLDRAATALGPDGLRAAHDRERDRFPIPGWEALPPEFVGEVRGRLGDHERGQLDALVATYRILDQRFFRNPSSLAVDSAASAVDFARLLHSLGNRVGQENPGDAERAYRLSLRLRPEQNLAHAGLALLLERTGRTREGASEARVALGVLDDYARRPDDAPAPVEDISPFKAVTSLRNELERLAGVEGGIGRDEP
jgi:hypothetical protein